MSGDKTEEPSHKKLEQAKEEGNVPKSKDFSTAIIFGASCWYLPDLINNCSRELRTFSILCFGVGAEGEGRLASLTMTVAARGIEMMLTLCLPLLGMIFALALVTGVVQTGGVFTTGTLMPKFDKLNPATGLQNIFFSGKTYIELAKNLAKLIVAGVLGYRILSSGMGAILQTAKLPLSGSIALTQDLTAQLLKQVGGFMFAIGAFDLWYQRKTWWEGLMMSKQEQKDEHKQSEGDPHTKHQRKKMAKEIANQKGTKDVAKAKVVVTNPHEIAVALEYEEGGEAAPQVMCKGERLVAQQIIEAAREAGVPIMQNIALAHSLSQLECGDEIPEDLYEAVAEVLNWVYSLAQQEHQI